MSVSRLVYCIVCGTGVMNKSTDGVTCGDQSCRDSLVDRINDLVIEKERVENSLRDIKENLLHSERNLNIANKLSSDNDEKLKKIREILYP